MSDQRGWTVRWFEKGDHDLQAAEVILRKEFIRARVQLEQAEHGEVSQAPDGSELNGKEFYPFD
jgi:hypothetical protein